MRSLGKDRPSRRATIFVAAGSLMVFQVLALVGAPAASAAGSCGFNLATETVSVTVDSGSTVWLGVDDTVGHEGQILFQVDGGAVSDCGSANIDTVTSVVVIGSAGVASDETFIIDNASGLAFPSTVSWSVDLGDGTGDELIIDLADGVAGTVTLHDATFAMNGASGVTAGVEQYYVYGGDHNDTLDASAMTDNANYVVQLYGAAGDDTITGGEGDDFLAGQEGDDTVVANDGDDELGGGPGDDYLSDGMGDDWVVGGPDADVVDQGAVANGSDVLSGACVLCSAPDAGDEIWYGDRTTSVALHNDGTATSGEDLNADGDASDTNEEADTVMYFESLVTGSADDQIFGVGWDETMAPGDGDDSVDGDGGTNTLSYENSSAAVTIDPTEGTATGPGADEFANVDAFIGSAFDDTLIYDGVSDFDGGDGVDLIDATAETAGVTIHLDTPGFMHVENAFGGSGPDELIGSEANNVLKGNGGDDDLWGDDGRDTLNGGPGADTLDGYHGNDTLVPGQGDDEITGGNGADAVKFNPKGAAVSVDLSLGFASGQGDDSFNDFIEMIYGTNKADQIVGGLELGGGAPNFRMFGLGGNDTLTGSAGNDTLKGGAGNDRLRGGAGDDDLYGGPGTDHAWGGAGDDFAYGVEFVKGCEG